MSIPESLASLLKGIRVRIFNFKNGEMASHLNDVRRELKYTPTVRHDDISKFEERKRGIAFEHIETYSRLLGIPTCALSFVSRYQREPIDEAVRVAEAMLKIAKSAQRSGQSRFTVDDLHYLAHDINLPFPKRPDLPAPTADRAQSALDEMAEYRARFGRGYGEDNSKEPLPLFQLSPKNGSAED